MGIGTSRIVAVTSGSHPPTEHPPHPGPDTPIGRTQAGITAVENVATAMRTSDVAQQVSHGGPVSGIRVRAPGGGRAAPGATR